MQVSGANMDTAELEREFGPDLVFRGGGGDTHGVPGWGSPADVRADVLRRVDDLRRGSAFVFAAVHDIPPHVPAENMLAMRAALREANGG